MSVILGPGPAVFAFDVGGTDTKSAVITAAGEVVGLRRTQTARSESDPAGAVVSDIARLVADMRERHPAIVPEAIGVAVPGLVDEARGMGIYSSNLGWRDAPLREALEEALAMPVGFGHDVRSAGRAEVEFGAAAGLRNVVVLAIGTGIAGSLIVGGQSVVSGGFAGELGHTLADPHGEPCPCGAVGCLETVAAAGAIARRYTAHTGIAVSGAEEVLSAATAGDDAARGVWTDAVTALAEHIARLAAVLAPEAVVIGGGLSEAGDALFTPLTSRVDALLSFHRRPQLLRAALGADAGLLGSALNARERVGA